MTRRYSIAALEIESAAYLARPSLHDQADEFAMWFANRINELTSTPAPKSEWPSDSWQRIRYAKELDAFEFMGHYIPRDQIQPIAIMLLRALDQADQLRYECPECKAERGFFIERGFQRCTQCGYPGQ